MKTNLSSQIKLDRTPKRLYAPADELERASLTREEKIVTNIFENTGEASENLAARICRAINKVVERKGKCVIALGAGRGTQSVYRRLVEMCEKGEVSFKNVVVFNLYEFFPLVKGGPCTLERLQDVLLSKVDIAPENVHTIAPEVNMDNMYEYCREYERAIEAEGGLDITICEIGPSGALALNEAGSRSTGGCRLVLMSGELRHTVSKGYSNDEACPMTGITLGIGNILHSDRILALAWGENRSAVVSEAVEGEITDNVPASFLQLNQHVTLTVDLAAAEKLTRLSHPWKVTSCEWNDKLIRRAIVWLCQQTNRPILKLTDKDYNDWGLGELVALYGSAYNVNIKVFNQLQHTITGWPGGKPGVDDTDRPERAWPYPKRVIVFSPHPDDDVISMGGTLKRLVDQGHDVHVAYETSGNIAVGDEDMMRYFLMMDKIAPMFGFDTKGYEELSKGVREFVSEKKPEDMDTAEIREIKTMIRQAEATIACKYIGVKDDHIHFLRLPFYETGRIKKGDLAERDIDIVKKLLEEVKPHEVFVAGDLADPHGTHRVCTDAVLAALYELRKEAWMRDCNVWMYRGAWAEWEIDHIEMAVPISPEELRFKRNSILKHQSQMENAPFLGNDDRLFWQRAEERNRATAKLYESLGLASYEAMEAFVQYHQAVE